MSHYRPGSEEKLQAYQDASGLKEKVEIYIACRDLLSLDLLSLSDPFVVVWLKGDDGKFFEVGRTEVLWDARNVEFERTVVLDYYFEKEQLLKFDVYDCDKKDSLNLADHDFEGSYSATLGELIHAPNSTICSPLLAKNGKRLKNRKTNKYQSIILKTEQAAESKGKYKLEFGALCLPKMDSFFGKVDPYFRVCRIEDTEKQTYQLKDYATRAQAIQYKSEIIKREYNPVWKAFEITTGKLFYKNKLKQFEIQVWDWDKNADDDFIGSVVLSESDLIKFQENGRKWMSFNIEMCDRKLVRKYSKAKDRNKPRLILRMAEPQASIYDFLQGGACDFSLMVSVDYTGSNLEHAFGAQKAVDLHHIYYDTNAPSDYQMAIRRIGRILETYDSDKQYPLSGFGAYGKFRNRPQNNTTSHGFNVNTEMLMLAEEEVNGIYGLEQAYMSSVNLLRSKKFQLSGPTYFSEILKNARETARESFKMYKNGQSKLNYFINLIITDGAVSTEDMLKTINEIVEIATSGLPMSIVIVGVGKGPFTSMNLLDGDFLEDINEIENNPKMSKGAKDDAIWNLVNENGYKMEYVKALKKIGKRDIVDFVELNDFDARTGRDKTGKSLENKTLEEIPTHFMKFVQLHGISAPREEVMDEKENVANGNGRFGMLDKAASLSMSRMSESISYADLENEGKLEGYNNRNVYYDNAPLPPQWDRAYMPDGRVYYVNHKNRLTQWMHPDDPTSPQKQLEEKQRARMPSVPGAT